MSAAARRRLLHAGALVSALLAGFVLSGPAVAQRDGERPAVAAAVQVTGNPAFVRAHSSPQVAVNPRNGELALIESDVRGSRRCNVHISTDGGRSWFLGGDPMRAPYTDCAFFAEYGPYATLAYGQNGTLYAAFVASEHLARPRDATPRHVFLARSEDGGRSFATTRVFEAPDGNPDRGLNKGPMLALDPATPSRVYVGWRQGVFRNATEKLKSNVAASRDGGRTFGPPTDITGPNGGDYPGLAVGRDGTVHAVYWTRTFPPPPDGGSAVAAPVRPLQYARSTDGGRTWTSPRSIDPGNQEAHRPPLLAADPRSDAVYMVWYSHGEANNGPEGFAGRIDVFFRRSLDGGETWSQRRALNDDSAKPTRANKYEASLSVAPNGRLDVVWYDFRLSPTPPAASSSQGESGLQDVFYTSSSDKGRTFAPNVRVTDRSIDRSIGVWSNNIDSKFNVGIASTEDRTYVAWQDTRNGKPDNQAEDVYATSLHHAGGSGSDTTSLPAWVVLLAGAGLGLGMTMMLVWFVARRRPPEPGGGSERGP